MKVLQKVPLKQKTNKENNQVEHDFLFCDILPKKLVQDNTTSKETINLCTFHGS